MSVYPNPTEGCLTVAITNLEITEGKLVLINVLGQVILEKEIELMQGKALELLDLSQLSKGVYTLSFKTTIEHYSQKVVLE